MEIMGDTFMGSVNDGDPDHTKKIASAYQQIVKSCGQEPLEVATTRITEEILGNLERKLEEMKPLMVCVVVHRNPNRRMLSKCVRRLRWITITTISSWSKCVISRMPIPIR